MFLEGLKSMFDLEEWKSSGAQKLGSLCFIIRKIFNNLPTPDHISWLLYVSQPTHSEILPWSIPQIIMMNSVVTV